MKKPVLTEEPPDPVDLLLSSNGQPASEQQEEIISPVNDQGEMANTDKFQSQPRDNVLENMVDANIDSAEIALPPEPKIMSIEEIQAIASDAQKHIMSDIKEKYDQDHENGTMGDSTGIENTVGNRKQLELPIESQQQTNSAPAAIIEHSSSEQDKFNSSKMNDAVPSSPNKKLLDINSKFSFLMGDAEEDNEAPNMTSFKAVGPLSFKPRARAASEDARKLKNADSFVIHSDSDEEYEYDEDTNQNETSPIHDEYENLERSKSLETNYTLTEATRTLKFWVFASTNAMCAFLNAGMVINLDAIFRFADNKQAGLSYYYLAGAICSAASSYFGGQLGSKKILTDVELSFFCNFLYFVCMVVTGIGLYMYYGWDIECTHAEEGRFLDEDATSIQNSSSSQTVVARPAAHSPDDHSALISTVKHQVKCGEFTHHSDSDNVLAHPAAVKFWLVLVGTFAGLSVGLTVIIQNMAYSNAFGRQHNGVIQATAKSIMVFFSAIGPSLVPLLHQHMLHNFISVIMFLAIIPCIVMCVALYERHRENLATKKNGSLLNAAD